MPVKHSYQEVKGSKYTVIQIEMQSACTLNDINMFLCSQFCSSDHQINNPQQASYFAFLINSIKVGIQGIKNKKDSPIQLSYGVCRDLFMISISFLTDNSMIRMVGKMLAEKCFQKNLNPAYQILSQVDKQVAKDHGKDKIIESMRYFQKNIDVIVMSKIAPNVFEGKPTSLGNKVIFDKMKEYQQKVEIPSSNPIPIKQMAFQKDDYNVNSKSFDNLNSIFWSLIQSSLNGQKIDYHIHNTQLYIRKKGMLPSTKELCFKYMKDRLAFTNSEKKKIYKDLPKEAKEKMTFAQFEDKQSLQQEKKIGALLQLLLQSASVPYDQVKTTHQQLKKFDLANQFKMITTLKEVLADMAKSK